MEALPEDAEFDEVMDLIGSGEFTPNQERVLTELNNNDWLGFDYPSQAISVAYGRRLDSFDPTPELKWAIEDAGVMYEVDIPDEAIDRMLDWDKPLLEQPESVRHALKVNETTIGQDVTGRDFYRALSNNIGEERASETLKQIGVPGIRYLDHGSRSAGEGTRNFVVFDEDLVTIKGHE